jgi:hypothetical protein
MRIIVVAVGKERAPTDSRGLSIENAFLDP